MTQPSEQIINIKNLSTAGKKRSHAVVRIYRTRGAQNKSEIIDQYKKDYPLAP